jgi:hypothetical protein
MAINRDVVARWVPALTPDIVAQRVMWKLNGAIVCDKLVGLRVNTRSFAKDNPSTRLLEGDKIEFSVRSIDEFGESSELLGSHEFLITPPDAPSSLVLKEKIRYRRIP